MANFRVGCRKTINRTSFKISKTPLERLSKDKKGSQSDKVNSLCPFVAGLAIIELENFPIGTRVNLHAASK